MLAIDNGKARAFTRNGYDWTARYATVIEACASLACRSALLDGEIVVEDTNGVSDFDSLPSAMKHLRNGKGLRHASVRAIQS
jgi:bifunctional non-homologous end joining protein LigD